MLLIEFCALTGATLSAVLGVEALRQNGGRSGPDGQAGRALGVGGVAFAGLILAIPGIFSIPARMVVVVIATTLWHLLPDDLRLEGWMADDPEQR